MNRTSSGNWHPYMKGFRFWSENRFWLNGKFSAKAVAYYEKWLRDLQANDKAMTRAELSKKVLKAN